MKPTKKTGLIGLIGGAIILGVAGISNLYSRINVQQERAQEKQIPEIKQVEINLSSAERGFHEFNYERNKELENQMMSNWYHKFSYDNRGRTYSAEKTSLEHSFDNMKSPTIPEPKMYLRSLIEMIPSWCVELTQNIDNYFYENPTDVNEATLMSMQSPIREVRSHSNKIKKKYEIRATKPSEVEVTNKNYKIEAIKPSEVEVTVYEEPEPARKYSCDLVHITDNISSSYSLEDWTLGISTREHILHFDILVHDGEYKIDLTGRMEDSGRREEILRLPGNEYKIERKILETFAYGSYPFFEKVSPETFANDYEDILKKGIGREMKKTPGRNLQSLIDNRFRQYTEMIIYMPAVLNELEKKDLQQK